MRRRLALIALGLSVLALGAAGGAAVTAAPPPRPGGAAPTPVCGPAWQVVASPEAPESSDNVLRRVAALAPDDIWAVGYYLSDSSVRETLTLHYDGRHWRLVDSPNLGEADNALLGLAAGDGVVWAVGSANEGSNETVTMRWTGAGWQPVASPNVGQGDNALRGVAIAAADDVWAVGASPAGALIEHWDGAAWQVAPAPADPRPLNAVAVAAPNDVWAVGDAGLIEHWDGAAWRVIAAPSSGALRDVAAAGPANVWAVGTAASRTLTERWDGQTWTVTPSPNGGQTEDALDGIVVTGPTEAWAVGSYRDYVGRSQSLIEHWDGAAWQVSASPVLGPYFNELFDVAAAGPGDVWAVGYRDERRYGPDETLTEHLVDPCPTPEPTSSPSPSPIPSPSATSAPSPTPAPPCALGFSDVPPGAYFYKPVEDLVCAGVVSGYADDAFHPYAGATRSQLVKIVALGLALPALTPPAGSYTFADTPPEQPFYPYIEAAARAGVVAGYACGGPAEPCDAQSRPYFRPYAPVTRAQIAKIVVLAAGWPLQSGATATFADVPPGAPLYAYVATAACHDLISGYTCGGPGEPCDAQNRPYVRPAAGATRAQIAKIVDTARQSPAACAPAP